MAIARGNGQNGGHFYSNVTQPVKIDLSFVVDVNSPTGVTSLKSNGYVLDVFMNSNSPSPQNPNPQANYIVIHMNNNYNHYLGGYYQFATPLSGSPSNTVTAGLAYIITSLGTTTLAQWQAAGVPAGVVPAVGVSFISLISGAIGGSGLADQPSSTGSGVTGVHAIEVIGNPDLSDTTSIAQYGGMWIIVGAFDSGTQTQILDGAKLSMGLFFDASSVTIDGL